MNKIDVVTVTYNSSNQVKTYAKSLKQALIGLKSQVWVVDNNSQDDTLRELHKNSFIKVIANRKNLGYGKANNQALRKLNSEYILLLNPDTETPKNTIHTMIKYMDQHENVGLITCRVEMAEGQLDRACRRGFPTPWRSICRMGYLDRLFPNSKIFGGYNLTYLPEDKVAEIDSAVGAFMLIRSKVLQEVGLFDEKFFMYGEDIDLCYRIKQKGWNIVYNPSAKIIHLKGVSSGIKAHSTQISLATQKQRAKMIYHFHEAMHIFYNKHYKNIYPAWLTKLVMAGINLKMYAALTRLKLRGY